MTYESLIMLVVLIAVFYFLLIRPENKRKKQAQAMRDSLKKGDVITTIGGIIGKIVMVNGDTLVIETSEDRVRLEITKWAISTTGVQASTEPTKEKKKKEEEDKPAEEPAQEAAQPAEDPVDEIPAPEEEQK